MKRLNVFLTVFACLAAIGLISCNSSKDQTNEEYKADIEKFKAEIQKKIEANKKIIAGFNEKAGNMKEDVRANYKQKMNELQQKNAEMKRRMDSYKAESKQDWESFKTEFRNDINELTSSLHNLIDRNKN